MQMNEHVRKKDTGTLPRSLMWMGTAAALFWEDASDSTGVALTSQRGSSTKTMHTCQRDPALRK
jgi:hypothetical protein